MIGSANADRVRREFGVSIGRIFGRRIDPTLRLATSTGRERTPPDVDGPRPHVKEAGAASSTEAAGCGREQTPDGLNGAGGPPRIKRARPTTLWPRVRRSSVTSGTAERRQLRMKLSGVRRSVGRVPRKDQRKGRQRSRGTEGRA